MVNRGDVYWIQLDPTVGSEIQKKRPCLVVSPSDMNHVLPRVIIATLTSKGQALGCRPELIFKNKHTRILLDQIRCVVQSRLREKMGTIELKLWHNTLLEMLS